MSDKALRVLVAAGDERFRGALGELAEASRSLLPTQIEVEQVSSLEAVRERLGARAPDVLILDWYLAAADVLTAIQELAQEYPGLRTLVLLPDSGREYREAAWNAGACACVPRDRIDPEWLQAILCVMNRAKEREEKIRRQVA